LESLIVSELSTPGTYPSLWSCQKMLHTSSRSHTAQRLKPQQVDWATI
jgi:hypothetical protein